MSINPTSPEAPVDLERVLNQRRITRLVLGFTLTMFIAYLRDEALAFLLPVLFTALSSMAIPAPGLNDLFRQAFQTLLGFSAGLLLAVLLLPYPLVFTLMLGLGLFYSYYLLHRGASLWLVLMLIMSQLMFPLLKIQHQQLAAGVFLQFIVFAWSALLLMYLLALVFPDPQSHPVARKAIQAGYQQRAASSAAMSTLVVLPLAVVFIRLELSGQLLILVFVGIFSLSPQLDRGIQAARTSIRSTLLGGVTAYAFYALLVAVPEYLFFTLLNLVVALVFGRLIFSSHTLAPYLGSALTTLILLVNASMGEGAEFSTAFMTRLGLIMLAAMYVVAALRVLAGNQARAGLTQGVS